MIVNFSFVPLRSGGMQFLIVYISIPCVEEGQKGRLLAGLELLWWWYYIPVLMQNSVIDGCACPSVVSLLNNVNYILFWSNIFYKKCMMK